MTRARFTKFWTLPDRAPSNPDCLIVPSYALKDRATPTRPTRAQIELAAAWWRKFPRAHIVMCTGDNQGLGVTNARVMCEYALRLGVPRENLIEEDASRNTRENLFNAWRLAARQSARQPTLVTLDLYTRRAVATARKQGWRDFYWLSVYAEGESAYGLKAIQTHSRATILCYEMIATMYSKVVGWI
ncbi:MAG: YdcF family protein [Chloroflexi bacterium]|nr:YdcF family protein [Chloroflexota bacterium]